MSKKDRARVLAFGSKQPRFDSPKKNGQRKSCTSSPTDNLNSPISTTLRCMSRGNRARKLYMNGRRQRVVALPTVVKSVQKKARFTFYVDDSGPKRPFRTPRNKQQHVYQDENELLEDQGMKRKKKNTNIHKALAQRTPNVSFA